MPSEYHWLQVPLTDSLLNFSIQMMFLSSTCVKILKEKVATGQNTSFHIDAEFWEANL